MTNIIDWLLIRIKKRKVHLKVGNVRNYGWQMWPFDSTSMVYSATEQHTVPVRLN